MANPNRRPRGAQPARALKDRDVAISLHVLPPVDPAFPLASAAYLKGYFNACRARSAPRVIYWNQTIDRLLQAELGNLWNRKYGTLFYQTLFAYIFTRLHDAAPSDRRLEYLEAQGALSLLDYSIPLFRKTADRVCSFLQDEAARLALDRDDVVGCSMGLNQLIPALAFLFLVKSRNPRTITVLGGAMREEAQLAGRAFPFVDLCIYGEGEAALLELYERLRQGREPATLAGAVARRGGEVRTNAEQAGLADINGVFADYEGFQWQSSGAANHLFIWDSRSCRWKRCRFCSCRRLFGAFRERSPESLEKEIRYHLERFPELAANPLYVRFLGVDFRGSSDAALAAKLDRLAELKRDYPNLRFFFWLSPGYIDEPLMARLNRVGADIQFGFEQWSRLVEVMRKPHRIENGIFTLKLVDKYPRITVVGFNILVGFPGEEAADLHQTQSALYKLRFILARLMRRKKIIGGFLPTEVVIEGTSALGRSWDWDDAVVKESLRNDPVGRMLRVLTADEAAADQLVRNKGWVMCDLTGTQRLGKSLIDSFEKELPGVDLRIDLAGEAIPVLRARDTGRRSRELVLRDGLFRDALALTWEVVAAEELLARLRPYDSDCIVRCLRELQENGLLFCNPQTGRYVNTLPWSIQRRIKPTPAASPGPS